MNGRVYDYNLGRFLSVDPIIQSVGNSQGINPYSYIMNNPLSGTDPTGYEIEEVEKKVKVAVTGSRIKRTVTVSAKSNGSGGATVTISGGNGAARSAVKGALTNNLTSAGFNVADIGSQQQVAKSTPQSGGGDSESWSPTHVKFKKGVNFSDFNSDTQDAIKSLDAEIGNYRAALDRGLADAKENGGDVGSFEEAIEAFGHTNFYYLNKAGPKGAIAIAGFRKAPLKDGNGNLMTDGKRTAVFYSGISDLYKNGAKASKHGNYTYKPIPSGGKGMFNLVAHEMSHTMVSRMYKGNGKLMKQYSRRGFERSADDWAIQMEKYR